MTLVAPPVVGSLRDSLVSAGLLVGTSVDGLYLRSAAFENVLRGVEGLAHRVGASATASEPLLFLPPVMPRESFVRTDYLRSFPDLIGSIHTFQGDDGDHADLLKLADAGDDWTTRLQASEVTLSSAACHSLYAGLAGVLPDAGRRLEVQGTCFRHEPSIDPCRMQSFRMHEFVRVGTPAEALAHRDEWLSRGLNVLAGLGLPVWREVANDPFFGRAGRMLARSQRGAELKYEIVCSVGSSDKPVAIASANYHLDHFGAPFGITTSDGSVAHSACFGFGLERITIALFATHGTDSSGWPAVIRDQLWPRR